MPTPLALAAAGLTGAAGLALALARRGGLQGEALALAIGRHLVAPRRLALAPEGLAAALPGARGPRLAGLEPPVSRIRTTGVVELADGSHCLILAARGTSFGLRGADEQAAFVAAFGRFLNGLTEPVQIVVLRQPASLEAHARAVESAASGLPETARTAAADHARFLRGLGGDTPLWRRSILVVVRSRERRDLAAAALERASAQAAELLGAAEVSLTPLDGAQAAALLARVLDPPGPPAGSHLEGVIRVRSTSVPPRHQDPDPRSPGPGEPGGFD